MGVLGRSQRAGAEEPVAGEPGRQKVLDTCSKVWGVRGSWRRGLWVEFGCFTKVSFCEQRSGHFWGDTKKFSIAIEAVVTKVCTAVKSAPNRRARASVLYKNWLLGGRLQ